jgi:hypothetical protein
MGLPSHSERTFGNPRLGGKFNCRYTGKIIVAEHLSPCLAERSGYGAGRSEAEAVARNGLFELMFLSGQFQPLCLRNHRLTDIPVFELLCKVIHGGGGLNPAMKNQNKSHFRPCFGQSFGRAQGPAPTPFCTRVIGLATDGLVSGHDQSQRTT